MDLLNWNQKKIHNFKDSLKPNNGGLEPFVTYNLKKYFAKSMKFFLKVIETTDMVT